MFDQRSDAEFTQCFAKCLLVIALIGGQRPQIARVSAGDLLSEIRVTSFPSRRAVNVKDSLSLCIDEFRDFQLLHAVTYSLAVVAARC